MHGGSSAYVGSETAGSGARFVCGQSLAQPTAGNDKIAQVLYISLDIAQGLEYLHPTVLHRDLKPANVLLNNVHSPRPTAKLGVRARAIVRL